VLNSLRNLKITILVGTVISWGSFFLFHFSLDEPVLRWLPHLAWPLWTLHEMEEFILAEAVLGKKYQFITWADRMGFRLDVKTCFVINPIFGWPLALLLPFVYELFPVVPLVMISGLNLTNGMWHLGMSQHFKDFSPGVLTGTLLYIPFGIIILVVSVIEGRVSWPMAMTAFLLGAAVHFLLFLLIPKTEKWHKYRAV